MATYSIFILLAYFPQCLAPKNYGKWQSSAGWGWKTSFGSKKRDSTLLQILLHPHYVVLFLFQIHLLILLPNSCIVASRVSLVSSLGTPIATPTAEDWAYVKRCSLRVFLDSKLFSFRLYLFNNMKSRRRDVDSPIRGYRYVFKTISWNIKIHSELLLWYISLHTSSDV